VVFMGRTNIDIDDEVMRRVQAGYGLRTKREAVDFALRRLLVEPLTRQEALAAEGSGWDGDLDDLRAGTAPRR
jgi:Arc/MetJ family transcription regulator